MPSPRALEEHWQGGHVVYRDWCEICVQARGREDQHKKDGGKERTLPQFEYDFCFPGDDMGS